MITIKVFLASSSELKDDRRAFEIFINRKNKEWVARGVFLELVLWEDFLDVLSKTRLQNEYNDAIRGCDIFVMLFWTKVGPYTEEEFETAVGQFKAKEKPFILVYFRDVPKGDGAGDDARRRRLEAFQKKLDALGHYKTDYDNDARLTAHFGAQLEKLAAKGFIVFDRDDKAPRRVSNLPYNSLGPLFKGRDAALAELRQRLMAGGGRAVGLTASQAIHGLGGVGKTRLAIEYAWRQASDYEYALFVSARSPADLRSIWLLSATPISSTSLNRISPRKRCAWPRFFAGFPITRAGF
jgi:hypothetical protein